MRRHVLGKRDSVPPPRLTYNGMGQQVETQLELRNQPHPTGNTNMDLSARSGKGSSKTSASRKRAESLKTKEALLNLEHQYEDDLAALQDKKEDIEAAMNAQGSSKENEDLSAELAKISRDEKKLTRTFQRAKKHIEETGELLLDKIDLEDDDSSQYLGSDEETARHVPFYNKNNLPDDYEHAAADEYGNANYHPPQLDPVTQLAAAISQLGNKGGGGGKDRWLPEFNGDPAQWCIFISAYNRTTNKYRIENDENMARLQGALKGEAKAAVLHLMANVHNVKRIMQVLERRFGRPELVLDYLVERAKSCKSPDISKPSTLVEFGTTVEALVTNICAFDEEEYMYNKQLINELVRKMPITLQDKWYGWLIEDEARKPNLKLFSQWLERETRIAELRMAPELRFPSNPEEKGRKRRGAIHSTIEVDEDSRPACTNCGKRNHPISKCFAFKRKSLDERWEVVKSKRLCFLCLNEGHITKKCTSAKECGVDGCTYKHHALLHRKFSSDKKKETSSGKHDDDGDKSIVEEKDAQATSMNMVRRSTKELDPGSLAIIPIVVQGPRGKSTEFAFLDMGATTTLIEKDLSDRIGLTGKSSKFSYIVYGDKMQTQEDSKSVNLKISSANGQDCFDMQNVRTVSRIAIPKMSLNVEEMKERYPYLRKMKMNSFRNAQPRLLIGYDHFKLYAPRLILEDTKDSSSPIGCKSHLGWYLCSSKSGKDSINFLAMALAQEDERLHDMIKDFFSTENFGVKVFPNSHRSKEDKKALKMLEAKTKKNSERWETCLLWKNEADALPESKSTAIRFLKFMEKKMDDNPKFAKLCMEKFEDYISKGYLRKKVETTADAGRRYYLPWFFQFHPTKKPRLVFHAAAKTNGKCFNDFLMTGPDLLRPLPAVVMRFRAHLIALTADLKEFFHQVGLIEQDVKSQTVLYRGMDRKAPAEEFEMTRLFFGSTSSPCSAIYAKELNAAEYEDIYPEAVKAIKLDFFMDDFLGGADTVEEAVQLQQQLTEIHNNGGFPIVKWNSNNEKVLSSIPAEIRANEEVNFSEKSTVAPEKTLGLYWDPQADEFCFKLSFHRLKKEVADGTCVPTKRQVTSLIMAILDPLGFLAPLKIKGLILLQEIWRVGVDWDKHIPYNIYEEWKLWLLELEQVKEIHVPRRLCDISLKNAVNIQLHVFVDGSESGYACSAYLRIQTGGRAELKFIMGKSRVAPLKGLSVPRMELMAALMGSRLARTIKEAYQDQFKIDSTLFWCDSRCVLCWIRSTTGRFTQFVSNRIGEILETTNVENWRWVPSAMNAADDATRFVKNLRHDSQSRWLRGSSFLLKNEDEWPLEKVSVEHEENLERREVVCLQIEQNDDLADATGAGSSTDEECRLGAGEEKQLPNIDKFSSWHRLLRATAAKYWAVRKFIKKGPQYITTADMKRAELLWIKFSQKRCFMSELRCLQAGKPVENSSRIFPLSPGLDANGIIVMKGRLENAEVSDTVKYPPILDPGDKYVQLMIKWFHGTSQHFGQDRIINELRKHAWILKCRVAVRKCKSDCMICKKRSSKPVPPRMGQLPLGRIQGGHAPFHHTSVDYFGPFHVKIRRGTEKRWGVLFSCLTTRAVHLELAESLDASDFINALVRFMNLRGTPAHIWSDNGTNFVGGEREIRESLKAWDEDELRRGFGVRGIEWHFIPASSPHMGGSWERLVGVSKKILYQLLKTQEPKESVLRTLFTEITYIMNSRPITRASPDPDDLRCLTPNDLLNIKCVVGSAIPGLYVSGDRYRKSWRQVQLIACDFWKRWSVEYLPWLAKREKWLKPSKPLEVGDVVLILEDNAPRNAWKMGKIEKTFPAKDGQVRSVEVLIAHVDPKDPKKKVGFSYLRRPTMKICPLSP